MVNWKQFRQKIKSKTGFAVDTAIKVLTAVVLGALVLMVLYGILNGVVKTQTQERINGMYEYSGDAGTGGGGGGAPDTGDTTPDPGPGGSNTDPDGNAIPDGGKYYRGVTSVAVGDYTGGTEMSAFPAEVKDGDVYVFGDYEYRYNMVYMCMGFPGVEDKWFATPSGGWCARVLDDTLTKYGNPLWSINNKSTVSMYGAYANCKNMTEHAELPQTVVDMCSAYLGCTSMTTPPDLPVNTKFMSMTFKNCTNLKLAPPIPDSVENGSYAFENCSSMTQPPVLPTSLKSAQSMLSGCKNMGWAPVLPETLEDMNGMFGRCEKLEITPTIPSGVKNMANAFYGCTNLKSVLDIPESVNNLSGTFKDCPALHGTIVINAKLDVANNYMADKCTFQNAGYAAGCIKLTGTCDRLASLASTNEDTDGKKLGYVVLA